MNQPLPEEERKARARAQRQAWWAANPSYRAEYNAKHRDRDLPRKRENERARKATLKAEAIRRERDVERATQWAKANPEKRREARERHKAKNPEAYKAAQRDYYHRNKEKIRDRHQAREAKIDPDQLRELRRRENASTATSGDTPPKERAEEQREQYRKQSREIRRLDRQLQRAGLPPRSVHRTPVSERRRNSVVSEEFFRRTRTATEVREAVYGALDPVTESEQQEWEVTVAKIRQRSQFRENVQKYIRRHGKTLREEIAMDSRARELRGKSPLDPDLELRRRATQATLLANAPEAHPTAQPQAPTPGHRRHPAPGSSAPHVVPGASTHGPRLN